MGAKATTVGSVSLVEVICSAAGGNRTTGAILAGAIAPADAAPSMERSRASDDLLLKATLGE